MRSYSSSQRRSSGSAVGSNGGLLQVVGGQESQQVPDVVEAGLVVGGDELRHAGGGGVGPGAAQLLLGHVLARHLLHHVRAGDEHVGRLVDHEDEVGHDGAVHRAAGARAHDHADLRRHAGGLHVAVEDPAVAGQRDDALLDAGTGAVVEADDRRAHLERQVHHLVDLLGEHLAEGATEHREVLAEHEHLAAVDGAPAGDDTVAVGVLGQRVTGPVAGQHVQLVERALVQQVLDALAGQHLAPLVLAVDRPLRPGRERLFAASCQVLDPFPDGVFHGARS